LEVPPDPSSQPSLVWNEPKLESKATYLGSYDNEYEREEQQGFLDEEEEDDDDDHLRMDSSRKRYFLIGYIL